MAAAGLYDPSFEQRGIIQTIEHPSAGPYKMAGFPVRFSGRPPPVRPAPLLGADTEDVLRSWLDLGADEVGALRGAGAVG